MTVGTPLKAEMGTHAKPEVAEAFGNYLHDLQSTGVSNILSMMKQVELTGKKMSLDDGLELMNAAYSLDNHARSFSMLPFDNATVLEAKKFDWQILKASIKAFGRENDFQDLLREGEERFGHTGTGERVAGAPLEHPDLSAEAAVEQAKVNHIGTTGDALADQTPKQPPEIQPKEIAPKSDTPAVEPEVHRIDGSVIDARDAKGTLRTYEYEKNNNGESLVNKITIGEGEKRLTLERSNGSADEWTARQADGSGTKFQAKIAVNNDGSYTVSYITDQNATWYAKAFRAVQPRNHSFAM